MGRVITHINKEKCKRNKQGIEVCEEGRRKKHSGRNGAMEENVEGKYQKWAKIHPFQFFEGITRL